MEFTTDSHELAHAEAKIHGVAQNHQNNNTKDVGWHRPVKDIPSPVIGAIPNGRLQSMIRRFNKDVFDVRAVAINGSEGFDLKETRDDTHSTEKLTLHLQRGYLNIVLSIARFAKHISRLRSWKETRRTGAFLLAYFAGWIFDMLVPLFVGILIIIVTFPDARDILFPPMPLAIIDISTGGVQVPPAGELGTSNTLTGAPEKQEGEAVEEEAANFVDNLRHLVMRAIGVHENQDEGGNPLEGKIPKPFSNAINAVKSENSDPGHLKQTTDQTQKPMEDVIWAKAKPENLAPLLKTIPHSIGEIVDNFERFVNAISPMPPFSSTAFLRIDIVLVAMFFISFFVSYYIVYKVVGFAFCFLFFGDPIITPLTDWLNRNNPKWLELLEPKNNIFRGVPTNSQITLTLLRMGEANNTPLPPVPKSKPDDPDRNPSSTVSKSLQLEIASVNQQVSLGEIKSEDKGDNDNKDVPKHRHLSKTVRFFKGNIKAVVGAKLAVDYVRASGGSEKAKGHLGVLPKPKELIYAGPNEFKARFDGKKGWVYITPNPHPHMLFVFEQPSLVENVMKMDPAWKILIADITRLKRAAASSNKLAEKAADWSGDGELLASVEIDDITGKTWRFTAIPERDELFNRLIAIGDQKWENI